MDKESSPSEKDRKLSSFLEANTSLVSGHYCVPMLWKNESTDLPDNKLLAIKRFKLLKKRLRANPDVYEKYRAIINDYVTNGYARRMTKEETAITTPKTWYLPHHPVFNPKSLKRFVLLMMQQPCSKILA